MALEYTEDTEEKLNSLDKETIIQLFLSQQEQLKRIDHNLQLVLEQVADLKRRRFGSSSEKHEPDEQLSFMEMDGKIVFFNEPEAVADEEADEDSEAVPHRKPKRKQGKREEDLEGLFGKEGWKQLPNEVYRRYGFTIENGREDLTIAGCWSHARRRFDEAVKALPKAKQKDSRAYLALTMIQAIYREEKQQKQTT